MVIDFGGAAEHRHSRAARKPNHAHFDLNRVLPQIAAAGLGKLEQGELGFRDLHFVRASAQSS
ncbi:MAG TPA: hypothetical protein VEJ86_04840 [Candidatus Binataceae bacterium]|nr:hypothetical protein [Candidatus Binataceae bacterium]